MSMYDKFLHSLLPGNYALTKSMELTKIQDSGTLWYTKKFLTLYYYIFLSNDIMTTAYQRAIVEIFDNFIESLPEGIRESAKKYFYPENAAINFKSDRFNLFSNFASYNIFANQEERRSYYQSAKKYYFSLLMGSGGQTGIKRMLKEAVQHPNFVYSHANIDDIILRSAIDVCVREANAEKEITDNSVKYILSDKAMKKACRMAAHHPVCEADIRQLNVDYPHDAPKYRSIENDMIAFVRNERQILYYYGYFHSKSTGTTDFEFSSLTPIGELALKANYKEFLIIWEHQKIKMLSQPATTDINQISLKSNYAEKFGVSYTPYTDILGYLLRCESMSLDEYKYIVSRKKHCFDDKSWQQYEKVIRGKLSSIKAYVDAFGRQRDKADEDGRKELLKYILGIRDDLPLDAATNPLGVIKFKNSIVFTEKRDTLAMIYSVYSRLDNYKIQRYEELFESIESDLRRRYIATATGNQAVINNKVKIFWDLYNIHPDSFIMLSIAITFAVISLAISNVEDMTKVDVDDVSNFLFVNFKELLKALGLRTLASIKKEVHKVVFALKNGDYKSYLNTDEDHNKQVLARYRAENTADLLTRIQQMSATATVIPTENRERNTLLVSLLKSYYMQRYAGSNSMLKCECCGEETFVTNAGEPYVEFHHLIPFNIAYGPDHYLNLFALCPNCHRKIHFLSTRDKREKYENLNNNNYMSISLSDRLLELRSQNLLRSYHLEFLLADNAITVEEYNTVAA